MTLNTATTTMTITTTPQKLQSYKKGNKNIYCKLWEFCGIGASICTPLGADGVTYLNFIN